MNEFKYWLFSKTLWANMIFVVLAGVEANWHFLRGVIGDWLWGAGAFAVAITNIVLRLFTTHPLALKAKPAEESPPQQ